MVRHSTFFFLLVSLTRGSVLKIPGPFLMFSHLPGTMLLEYFVSFKRGSVLKSGFEAGSIVEEENGGRWLKGQEVRHAVRLRAGDFRPSRFAGFMPRRPTYCKEVIKASLGLRVDVVTAQVPVAQSSLPCPSMDVVQTNIGAPCLFSP